MGDRVLSKLPHALKGKSPYSEPKKVTRVIGFYTFLLDDGQVWNARKLRPFRTKPPAGAINVEPEREHFPQPPVQPHPQHPQRTSMRANKGAPPMRYGKWMTHRLEGDDDMSAHSMADIQEIEYRRWEFPIPPFSPVIILLFYSKDVFNPESQDLNTS